METSRASFESGSSLRLSVTLAFLLFCFFSPQCGEGALRPTRFQFFWKPKDRHIARNRKTAEHYYLKQQIHKINYSSERLVPFVS